MYKNIEEMHKLAESKKGKCLSLIVIPPIKHPTKEKVEMAIYDILKKDHQHLLENL